MKVRSDKILVVIEDAITGKMAKRVVAGLNCAGYHRFTRKFSFQKMPDDNQ